MKRKKGKIDWDGIAKKFGYNTPEIMLNDMVLVQNIHPNILALKLEVSISSLRSKLKEYRIKKGRKDISKHWGFLG